MVEYETHGRCALVTINRPRARNAVNAEVAEGLEAAVDRIEADDDIWVGILAGAPPVFCAGADLKAIDAGESDRLVTARGGFAGFVQRERTKPIIAAVEGPALAGGAEIVLACELVVASTAASIGIPEVKRALLAAAGGLLRLGRKLPVNVAMECALTGDPIEAERAYHFGLVNELCAPGQAVERALALADRICANAPIAVQQSRRVLHAATEAADDEGWALVAQAQGIVLASADHGEGVRAFIEKRPPAWSGR
jgi:enoyl-CoA hydratase/carnithine racemase